jgi:hypothetical protein
MGRLSLLSRVLQAKEQVSCDLAGETTILSVKSGTYYGLDCVGARIWTLIQQPKTLEEIRDTLIKEYGVDAARCETDLLEILEQLHDEGLIETVE